MRVLLLGADGQLGHELRGPLACFADLATTTRSELDLSDTHRLGELVSRVAPALIVNAAAYTKVDEAEHDPEQADRINQRAVAALGRVARQQHVGLIHISTDFVFDGKSTRPYREDDSPAPVNAYGRSKLAGELALRDLDAPAIVLRTAWVYSLRRKSFVSSILKNAAERKLLRVVSDQVGNPTFCRDLAQAIALLAHRLGPAPFEALRAARGIYHLAGSAEASRHELATEVVAAHPDPSCLAVQRIEPIVSSELKQGAPRPLRTVLDCSKIEARFGLRLPHWRDGLRRALADLL